MDRSRRQVPGPVGRTLAKILFTMLALSEALSFQHTRYGHVHRRTSPPALLAKKRAKAGKRAAGAGFGAVKSTPKKTAEECQWLTFMEWVTSSGGRVDAVRLANCGGGLRGIKATRDLAKGEGIIRIPRSIVLDVARAEASPVSGVWQQGDEPANLPRYMKLALAVLYEERRGAESKLRPYLKMLPSFEEFTSGGGPAAMWSEEELALTECGKLIDAARRRREQSCESSGI